MMRERPILFSAPMVRAILDGTKMQTRRILRPDHASAAVGWAAGSMDEAPRRLLRSCPYGEPGDRLWVREMLIRGIRRGDGHTTQHAATISPVPYAEGAQTNYCGYALWQWVRDKLPSIFMPRWASRIDLEIVGVRVERLQDISDDDIRDEGVPTHVAEDTFEKCFRDPVERAAERLKCWVAGWDGINGKRAPWQSNPWVWALTFKRVRP